MSSPIEVSLSPSRAAGLIAAAPWLVLFLTALVLAAYGPLYLLAFCPAALAGAIWQYRASGLLASPDSVVRLRVNDGRLQAELADGRKFDASPASESRLFSGLALLKLRLHATTLRPPLVVLVCLAGANGGNTGQDAFRRLRVWLRLSPATSTPDPTA